MTRQLRLRAALVAVLAAAPLAGGCASTQYQAALDEREAENKSLREERTGLKGQLRDARYQNESLEAALADANARLLAEPDTTAVQTDRELEEAGIGVGMRDGNIVYTVPDAITFASGKADLSSRGKDALKLVASRLASEYPSEDYWIGGHTDSDPIVKSKFASNRDLSLARAMAVLRYMVDDAGVKDGQCAVVGFGEYRPLAANDSTTSKAKNRRVEITVVKAGS
jgi:chemotaxis protein MotB